MSQSKTRNPWFKIAIVFAAAVYTILLVVFKRNWNETAWVFFTFTFLAFGALFLQTIEHGEKDRNAVFNVTSSITTVIYFILQLVVGGIIGMTLMPVGFCVALAVEIIFLAIYCLAVFLLHAAQAHTDFVDKNEGNSIQEDRILISKLQLLVPQIENTRIKNEVEATIKEFGRGYPNLVPELGNLQGQIEFTVGLLEEAVLEKDDATLSKYNSKLFLMLQERFLKAKAYTK